MSKVLKHKKIRRTGADGSVEEEETNFAVKSSVQPFSIIYPKELVSLDKLMAMDYRILFILVDRAEFNTGISIIHRDDRKEIINSLGITNQTFTNSICRLKNSDVISGTGGRYILNPKYIWKGTTNSRSRALKEQTSKLYDRPVESPGHQSEFGEDQKDLRGQGLGGQSNQGIPGQTSIFEEGTEEI